MGWNVKNIFHALLFILYVFSIEAEQEVKFVPSHYTIDIVTTKQHFEDGAKEHFEDDAKGLTYEGTVKIEFKKSADDNKAPLIVLNTNQKTELIEMKLKGKPVTGTETEDMDCPHKLENGKLIFNCPDKYKTRKEFTLTLKFKNPFGTDMTGFYRSSYEDPNKKKSWLLTTHFEPIFARNAFPCFDQPDLKAKFKISVTVPENIKTVLSNTELEGKTPDTTKKSVKYQFKETDIPMSTYLVAFTASNLKSTEEVKFKSKYQPKSPQAIDTTEKEKILRTYGRPDIIDRGDGDFAQKVGKAAIEGLTKYLDQGYALNKVDQVGIPDFSAGAMENFGHISFRERALFYNKDSSTTMTKQSNLLTIVHELVHQWFGNLVTLHSWDDIWLNEAFATYLEYVIAAEFNSNDVSTSDWRLRHQLVVNEIHSRAFETDGLLSSKALSHKIEDESLIYSAFNDIAYSKGAAVLRMWDYSHNKALFQESLKKYIADKREGTATPNDLFKAFNEVAKMEAKMFTTWTKQPGYPVVEVKKTGNDTYTLTQSRFLWEKSEGKGSWYIPITYLTSNDDTSNPKPEPNFWLKDDNKALELKNLKGKWVLFNNKHAGYYRVNYEKENWEALAKELNEKDQGKIPALNRAQILNDVFSLARSVQKNYVNYSTAFDLAKYLKNEKDFIPLKTALNSFEFLRTKVTTFDEKKIRDNFQSYVLDIIKPHFQNLSSTESNHIEKLKKVDVTRWACSLDYDPCVKQSKEIYNKKDLSKYPDIQETVLCTVVRTNASVWDEIFKMYQTEKDSALRVMYLTALGCTSDSKKAEEFLGKTLKTDSGIRSQDLMYVLSAVYNGNSKNLDTAFNFVEKNFNEIAKTYGGINPLGRAIVGIARKINTKDRLKKLEDLIKKVKESPEGKDSTENLDNALQIAKSNCEWSEAKSKQFGAYFSGSSALASSLGLLLLCLLFVFRL